MPVTTSETVLVIIGGFLLAGAVLAVAREMVNGTGSRARSVPGHYPGRAYLRGPKVKQEPVPQAAPEPAKDARIVSLGEAS